MEVSSIKLPDALYVFPAFVRTVVPGEFWMKYRFGPPPAPVSAPEIVVVTPSAGLERTTPRPAEVLLTLFANTFPLTFTRFRMPGPLKVTFPVPTEPCCAPLPTWIVPLAAPLPMMVPP